MKLLTTQKQFESEFKRLQKKYSNFYWASAWAGINSEPFEALKIYEGKIRQLVFGIHFYQTHPDFIASFVKNKKVRYILQPAGTFHPKIYLFTDSKTTWELILGSGNFTKGAFTSNMEASVLIGPTDINSEEIYSGVMNFINQCWKDGKVLSPDEMDAYRLTWENLRPKFKSLSGTYGSKSKDVKPIHEVDIICKTWEEFVREVKSETAHGVEKRLRVIETARDLFRKEKHFRQLEEDERKYIAGIPNKLKVPGGNDWAYFGSMKGAGVFKNRVIENDKNISDALQEIPLEGQVTKRQYERSLQYYRRAFSNTRLQDSNNLATASRLLAMKRPDVFVCYDSQNRRSLSKDFGIKQIDMNYDRYWDDVICRIYDSEWWLNPNPKDVLEEKISQARAAFLDSLYYSE